MARQRFLMANWKMYKTVEESKSYARSLARRLEDLSGQGRTVEVVLAPTALALDGVVRQLGDSEIGVAGQNLDLGREGAFTGAVSAYLLAEAGARYVIVGHSERRQHFGETDALIADKVRAAWQAGLVPVLCFGETREERERGETADVLRRQLGAVLSASPEGPIVLAYEPVWAIGTGLVPRPADLEVIAGEIGRWLEAAWGETAETIRLLYGGSVKAENLGDFLAVPRIDGALVGGASLDAAQFAAMVAVAQR